MSLLQTLLDDWAVWEENTFPQATTDSRLKHLKSEVKELIDNQDDLMEYVDALCLLLLAARSKGYNISELEEGMVAKLMINMNRKWGKPNEDGYVEHIK